MQKICFKCGTLKPLSMFYKHKRMGDGHLNKCIECAKKDVRKHRKENDSVREYDRKRAKQPHRVSATVQNTSKYRSKFPERQAANNAVAKALKAGMLEKLPCWECGETETEAHHPAYSMRLSVVWLCSRHHKEIHLLLPEL